MSSRRFGFRDADFSLGEDDSVFGPKRLYNRSDEEIEDMIERVRARMFELKRIFETLGERHTGLWRPSLSVNVQDEK